METLNIVLKGASPLLMHSTQSMINTDNDGLKRKKVHKPEEEAAKTRYVTDDEIFYVPAVAVRNSMLNGAKGYRIGKLSAQSILSGAVILLEEIFPLTREGEPIEGDKYEIDIRRVVVQRQGIMRARAKIALPWEVTCRFGFNSDLASLEHIKTALDAAGQIVGLLDYRPERKGWFGRYEVQDIWSE